MLGLRAAFRTDFGCSVAELVYGQALRLPGDYFEATSQQTNRSEFAEKLRNTMGKLKPTPPNHHAKPTIFMSPELSTCTHVFIRIDAVKKPLVQPCEGPFKVILRHAKYMDVFINSKVQRISIDRIKPAFICDEEKPKPAPKTKVTQSGHRVRFLV
ncbi:uncharacterized protein LOC131429092 [Malaya genurostris]|uniref:uncharacterized protein LOC131429092 n=1 Tax=Malaya genurostris TaxID=325434 RepID=UPI0026F3FBE9|nr:uncharacterized protein LOC131429092 [Malaya genurostris]